MDGDCQRVATRRSHRAVGQGTCIPAPNLSPVGGAGNYSPRLSSLTFRIKSTTRDIEHINPYSQNLPKHMKKKASPIITVADHIHQMLPDCPAKKLFAWAALANPWAFRQEAKQLAEGLTRPVVEGEGLRPIGLHQFCHPHPIDTISYPGLV